MTTPWQASWPIIFSKVCSKAKKIMCAKCYHRQSRGRITDLILPRWTSREAASLERRPTTSDKAVVQRRIWDQCLMLNIIVPFQKAALFQVARMVRFKCDEKMARPAWGEQHHNPGKGEIHRVFLTVLLQKWQVNLGSLSRPCVI